MQQVTLLLYHLVGAGGAASAARWAERFRSLEIVGRFLPDLRCMSYFLFATGPIGLPHLPFERLTRRVSRKVGPDDNTFDALIASRHPGIDPVPQLFRRGIRANAQYNGSHGCFSPLVVRNAEHGNLMHGRVLDGNFFDVLRINLHAAGIDHVFLTIDKVEISLIVNMAQIASMNPSIADRLGCQIVAVDIPGHGNWAAANNLAYLTRRAVAAFLIDDAHVVERRRYPDRACLAHRVGAVKQRDEAFSDPVNFVKAIWQDAVDMFLVGLMQRRAERENHFQ